MALSEFALIEKYFTRPAIGHAESVVAVGVGDDAAVLRVPDQQRVVISVDTLVEGVHFLPTVAPADLGHKVLAVSLSDLAAMGAQPQSVLLALTLPNADEAWLSAFSEGFWALADQHGVALVGGNTTRGPLNLASVVYGVVPEGEALMRTQAKVGDGIFVTGTFGDAGLALAILQGRSAASVDAAFLQRLHRPTPRVSVGLALRGLAHAAIDVSDGLAADVQKMLNLSRVGAVLEVARLPLSPTLQALPPAIAWEYALLSGDDYELCFTAPESAAAALATVSASTGCCITRIGSVVAGTNIVWKDIAGAPVSIVSGGYDHFGAACST